VVLLGVGLWRYTLPRLPGETTVTQRAEARELKALSDKAKKTGAVEDLLAWGRKAFELKAFDQAAEAYLEVLKKDPQNVEAVRRVGILLFLSGRPEEARLFLEIAQHADPKAAEGWLFLGNLYFQEGRYGEAIAAWERYLEVGGEARERVQGLIAMARAQAQGGKDGKSVYQARCAACHGARGEGGVGPRLQGNPILKAKEAVREIVLQGRGTMPAVPLSPEELSALLDYLDSL
jgi:mono/diheme cytochrome c family protein